MIPLRDSAIALILLVFASHAVLAAPRTPGDPAPKLELIGEGTISTDQDEFGAMPDKDWTTLYFNRSVPAHYHYVMYLSHFKNGTWSLPETLPFSGEYRDSDPVLSADGRTLYFVSDRPAEGLEPNRFHVWSADRTASGWTNLHPLGGPVNEKGNTEFVSFAANGNLYFTSDRSGSSFDVYRCRLVNAQYQPAESLGPAVNDGRYTIEAFIAPDESFILLGSFARDSLGNADLYITYNENGVWSKPVNSVRLSTARRATTVLAFHLTEGIYSFQVSVDFRRSLTTTPPRTKNSLAVFTELSTVSAISIAYL